MKWFKKYKLHKARKTIEASGLFDPQWYLQEYPDVSTSGMHPLVHYIKFGVKEGRSPGVFFNEAFCDAHSTPSSRLYPVYCYFKYGLDKPDASVSSLVTPQLEALKAPTSVVPAGPSKAPVLTRQPSHTAYCLLLGRADVADHELASLSQWAGEERVFVFAPLALAQERVDRLCQALPKARFVFSASDSVKSFADFIPILMNEGIGWCALAGGGSFQEMKPLAKSEVLKRAFASDMEGVGFQLNKSSAASQPLGSLSAHQMIQKGVMFVALHPTLGNWVQNSVCVRRVDSAGKEVLFSAERVSFIWYSVKR
ncbi:hypothetical protein DN062_02750 [Nitrincola tibetensis]|uniref:Uncharacterized protein n=1 Tax=Nitrincola tibetensis TaxID=2219697 RepID=A0A364NQN5_9GAMM|nr:hypothetical protein [Nitrincola tibetensis]RAU19205.1 hypothetical protein DN062_02750 [Nitrincola tibetensis]